MALSIEVLCSFCCFYLFYPAASAVLTAAVPVQYDVLSPHGTLFTWIPGGRVVGWERILADCLSWGERFLEGVRGHMQVALGVIRVPVSPKSLASTAFHSDCPSG